MKKLFTSFLLIVVTPVLLLAQHNYFNSNHLDPYNPEYVKGEILIKFKDEIRVKPIKQRGIFKTGIASVDKTLEPYQIKAVNKVFKETRQQRQAQRNTKTIHDYRGNEIEVSALFNIYKLQFDTVWDVKQIVKKLKEDKNVDFAEPNYIATMSVTPNDPFYSQQTGLTAINAPQAWDIETGDSSVIIGIIDTGVEWDHPDLSDKIWENSNEIPDNGIDDDGNGYIDDVRGWNFIDDNDDPYDDNGHGTHVSGIAAASTDNGIGIAGVSWGSKIMIIKALSFMGSGSYGDLAQAVEYASNNGAKVINMSLGGYANSYTLLTALENAYSTSIIVASAGNDGLPVEKTQFSPQAPCFPAAYSFVLGVQVPGLNFSNYDPNGPTTTTNGFNYELGAPGVQIYSTWLAHSYGRLTGTSMAAPFVSGAVALLCSHFPDWSNDLTFGQLIQTSNGLINIYSALTTTPVPVLAYQNYSVIDTISVDDDDGVADAGETVELVTSIKNFWGQADTVSMTIRLKRPWHDSVYINIIDSISSFGNISAYATVNNEPDPFKIEISSNTPNNSNIMLEYTISCANSDSVWEGTFWLTTQRGIELSGIFSSDTTLSNGYLYIVTGNMLVNQGVTLTIEPGTRIQFNAGKYLRIDGCLVANGTADSTIILTSNCQSHAPGDWEGLRFTGSAESAIFDTNGNYISGSILKYTEVELSKGISISNCSPYISNCEIHDNYVHESGKSGIYLDNSNSIVEYNHVYENDKYYNSFCSGHGAGIDVAYGGSPVIRYNLIESNRGACLGGGVAIEAGNPLVSHNIIRGNSSASYSYGYGGGGLYMNTGVVEGNNIYDNYTIKWGGGAPLFPTGGGVFYEGGTFKKNNLINNIDDGIQIKALCCPYDTIPDIIDSNNIFNNRSTTPDFSSYEHFDLRMATSDAQNCFNNYWGTSNSDTIAEHIWDFLDDFDLGMVTFEPYETLPVEAAPGFLYNVQFTPPSPIGNEEDTITLIFSKPMDTTYPPYVTFGVREPFTQHQIDGIWTDSTHWQGIYSFDLTTGDGINHLRVVSAKDEDSVEIPKDKRFSFIINAAGAESVNFMATPGIGKVELEWNNTGLVDFLGFNMYRYMKLTDSTHSNPQVINTSLITDTVFTDFNVIPDSTYYYYYKVVNTDLRESDSSKIATATPFNAANGDANGDLSVSVLDITTIVSYMLNQNPTPFIFDAADVNGDNTINVLDIIGCVQIISGAKSVPLSQIINTSNEVAYYEIEDGTVYLESSGNVAALQFETDSLSPQQIEQLRIFSKQKGFEFAYGKIENHIIGILYSLTQKVIPEGNQKLFKLEGITNESFTINNIFGGDLYGDYVPVLKKGEQLPVTDEAVIKVSPNPFNGITRINYSVPENGTVSLKLYNLSGSFIRSFATGYCPAGSYSFTWDGTNNSKQQLKPGIYLLQMEENGDSGKTYHKEVKIVLVK